MVDNMKSTLEKNMEENAASDNEGCGNFDYRPVIKP